MPSSRQKQVARELIDRHGPSYAEELGADLTTPSGLYRLAVAATLFSARISARIAVRAAQALFDQGWTTAAAMADATWKQRTDTLNGAGYARYDERTSSMLGDAAELVRDRWGGDLRNLRDEAGRDPDRERALLKELKGIGDVGVDIFFREVQATWDELYPFGDDRALAPAAELGLGDDAAAVAGTVSSPQDFVRLLAALIRADAADDLAPTDEDGPDRQGDLADLTVDELYERARDLDIPGRSKMDKAALARAVADAS